MNINNNNNKLNTLEFKVKKQEDQILKLIQIIEGINSNMKNQRKNIDDMNVQIQILMGQVGGKQGKLF
jgi:uncharacterized coiled-coil protein SlyX